MLIKKASAAALLLMVLVLLPVTAQEAETLAVLDFTTEAVSEVEMKAIVEFLSAELFKTGKYTVIDVSQRETILKEMEFSMSGCSDDSCALEIGKMLSAEMIVTGNLSKVGSRYLMSVKMLETETSKTMGTANGKYTNLDDLIDGLEPIALSLTGTEVPEAVAESKPVPAAEPEPVMDEVVKESEPAERVKPSEVKKEKPKSSGSLGGAIACTSGGVIAMGVGGYFLYNLFAESLPEYHIAKYDYDNAFGEADYEGLHDLSLDAYDNAVIDLAIGAGAAGLGAILTVVGIILFPPPEDKGGTEVSLSPVISNNPGMVVRVSY